MAAVQTRQEFADYCLQNKYNKWYFSIVNNALSRGWTKKTAPVYVESHHIIPQSIFKNNDTVLLTAREHFLCHALLPKFVTGQHKYKMLTALVGMKRKTERTQFRYINSKLYDLAKKEYSDYKKQQWKTEEYRNHMVKIATDSHWDSSGQNNPMYGKKGELCPHYGKSKSKEHKEKIKQSLSGIKHTEERRKKMSLNSPKNSLGKKWYHNPLTKQQKYFIQGQEPHGFVLGRG